MISSKWHEIVLIILTRGHSVVSNHQRLFILSHFQFSTFFSLPQLVPPLLSFSRSLAVSLLEFAGLVIDHGLEELSSRLEIVEAPVKGLLRGGFLLFVVQAIEVGVSQAVLDSVSLVGIENQHLAQKVKAKKIGLEIQSGQALLASLGERFDVFKSTFVANIRQILVVGGTQNCNDSLDLIQVVLTWEEGGSTQKLSQDAAN
jgi:hypothetical protein